MVNLGSSTSFSGVVSKGVVVGTLSGVDSVVDSSSWDVVRTTAVEEVVSSGVVDASSVVVTEVVSAPVVVDSVVVPT